MALHGTLQWPYTAALQINTFTQDAPHILRMAGKEASVIKIDLYTRTRNVEAAKRLEWAIVMSASYLGQVKMVG